MKKLLFILLLVPMVSFGQISFECENYKFTVYEDDTPLKYNFMAGDLDIDYDYQGRVESIGDLDIDYDYQGRVESIGDLDIDYDYQGRIDQSSFGGSSNILSTEGSQGHQGELIATGNFFN